MAPDEAASPQDAPSTGNADPQEPPKHEGPLTKAWREQQEAAAWVTPERAKELADIPEGDPAKLEQKDVPGMTGKVGISLDLAFRCPCGRAFTVNTGQDGAVQFTETKTTTGTGVHG